MRATVRAVLSEVAAAPPYRYRGGGYWEAMHGDMAGIFEIRVAGPNRRQYRLFCVIDSQVEGVARPYLTVVAGLDKPFMTKFSGHDYAAVRALRDEYLSRRVRSLDG